jgi:NAD(P)-dependent dehydrogenase (short-subunit alcohol dehydrogenase family)
MPTPRPVALVTGASRGLGKAVAIALAATGHDLVITARTMIDGERRLESDAGIVVPGGLDTTATAIERHGVTARARYMDVLDRATVVAAVHDTVDRFGRIDVVVNNAIHQGPGAMVEFLDLEEEQLSNLFEGNVFAQLALLREAVPEMLAAGGGTVINMISATAYATPRSRIGSGGWGMGYAMTKAALARVAPLLDVELAERGIRAFSVDPGHVPTERQIAAGRAKQFEGDYTAGTPAAIGAAVAWLCTDPESERFLGSVVHAQELARDLDLASIAPDVP